MTTEATPGALGSNAGLGPLLAEADMEALAAVAHQAGLGGIDLHALARVLDAAQRVAAAAERERCAAWVDARRDAFCEEHSSIDPDTGALEFGRGPHAEAKSEYVGELEEIAAGLRALAPDVRAEPDTTAEK